MFFSFICWCCKSSNGSSAQTSFFSYPVMEMGNAAWSRRFKPAIERDGPCWTTDSAYTTTDAPVEIHLCLITRQFDGIHRTYFLTCPAACTFFIVCFTDEIDGHQGVARDFSAPYDPNIPAIMSATITCMLDASLGVVNHVHQTLFFALMEYVFCLVFGNLAGKPP